MFDGIVNALPPYLRSVQQFQFAVVDVGIRRFGGLAFEDQTVEAGPAQTGRRPASMVRIRYGPGQGRLGHDRHASAHVGFRSRQRTVHEAQDVVGRKSVHLRAVIKNELHTEAASADVLASQVFGYGLELDLAFGQIHPCEIVGISSECHDPFSFLNEADGKLARAQIIFRAPPLGRKIARTKSIIATFASKTRPQISHP